MSEKEEIPKVSPREVFDRLTFGVVKSLEKKKGVFDIHVEERKPAERHLVVSWEQKHSCILPEDVKSFYLTMNGLLMTWKVKFDEVLMRLGRMEINPISELKKLNSTSPTIGTSNNPSLCDIDSDSETDEDEEDSEPAKPHFDSRSRIFELDPCEGTGKVCLVFKNTKPGVPAQGMEIWFLDRALRWNFLTDSFTHYFRMMIMHLGLPQWQYAFTDMGLSQQAKFPDVVELNVGGAHYTTCLTTLRKHPESMLATMFSGRHRLARDKDGRYFIDRDGTYFKFVLEFLRTDELPDIPQSSLEHAYKEAQFYGLDPLMVRLENTPKMTAEKLRRDYLNTFDDFENLLDSVIEEAKKPLSKCPYRATYVKIGLSGIMLQRNLRENENFHTGEGHNCYVTQKAFCIFHPLHTCKKEEVDLFMECLKLELSSRGLSAQAAGDKPSQCPWCTKWLHEVEFTWW